MYQLIKESSGNAIIVEESEDFYYINNLLPKTDSERNEYYIIDTIKETKLEWICDT